MRRCSTIIGGVILLFAAATGLAQDSFSRDFRVLGLITMHAPREDAPVPLLEDSVLLDFMPPLDAVPPPRMSPDLALVTYLSLAHRQLDDLGAYSDATVIEADLPDTSQHGKYELRRTFLAPRTLGFAAIHFVGDSFVKTNIITRLLQSEVDHVQKGEGALTAITGENYKFSFKGTETVDGRLAYVFQVKPRHKRLGLFKGRILVDAATGHLCRAEGVMVKSPSLFVKKLEFVQDYADFGPFSLPVHVHSVAKTRLVGRAVVDIFHQHYEAKSVAEVQSQAGGSGGSSSASSN